MERGFLLHRGAVGSMQGLHDLKHRRVVIFRADSRKDIADRGVGGASAFGSR